MSTIQNYTMVRRKKKTSTESMKKKQTNVDIILPEIYDRLQEDAKTKTVSLRRYVNDLFEMYYEKEDFMLTYLPQLKKIAFKNGKMYVEDDKLGKISTIGLKDETLHCDVCNSTECVHVIYAMSTLELARIEPKKK